MPAFLPFWHFKTRNWQITNWWFQTYSIFNLSESTTPFDIFPFCWKAFHPNSISLFLADEWGCQTVDPLGAVWLPESHLVLVTKIPAGQFWDLNLIWKQRIKWPQNCKSRFLEVNFPFWCFEELVKIHYVIHTAHINILNIVFLQQSDYDNVKKITTWW